MPDLVLCSLDAAAAAPAAGEQMAAH
jgi:hypothetical protein